MNWKKLRHFLIGVVLFFPLGAWIAFSELGEMFEEDIRKWWKNRGSTGSARK